MLNCLRYHISLTECLTGARLSKSDFVAFMALKLSLLIMMGRLRLGPSEEIPLYVVCGFRANLFLPPLSSILLLDKVLPKIFFKLSKPSENNKNKFQ